MISVIQQRTLWSISGGTETNFSIQATREGCEYPGSNRIPWICAMVSEAICGILIISYLTRRMLKPQGLNNDLADNIAANVAATLANNHMQLGVAKIEGTA